MYLSPEAELRQFNAQRHLQHKPSCELPQVEEKVITENPMSKVPPERLKAMQDYAKKLKLKHPHMQTTRIMRKVAEEFKIKLV